MCFVSDLTCRGLLRCSWLPRQERFCAEGTLTAQLMRRLRFNLTKIPLVWGPWGGEAGAGPVYAPGALGLAASPAVPRARRYPVQVNNNTAR